MKMTGFFDNQIEKSQTPQSSGESESGKSTDPPPNNFGKQPRGDKRHPSQQRKSARNGESEKFRSNTIVETETKYRVLHVLGSGGFGDVYKVKLKKVRRGEEDQHERAVELDWKDSLGAHKTSGEEERAGQAEGAR
ncbi:unnamed protein product, partial [Mesorhabditis belari]|uniref:Protein kinase domain-containing protein n=1 Tax=Mesorhabditis belari TaxID=2138241 RepID=A0AAF3FRF0_9BILA